MAHDGVFTAQRCETTSVNMASSEKLDRAKWQLLQEASLLLLPRIQLKARRKERYEVFLTSKLQD